MEIKGSAKDRRVVTLYDDSNVLMELVTYFFDLT